jgi:hypothetical protein
MPLAGDIILATHVTWARPTIIDDAASSSLVASSSDVDVPGISISFTTETASALVSASWFMQAQNSGAVPTGSVNARARITGPSSFVAVSSVYSIYRSGAAATDQATVGQQTQFTLGAAGAYTATLRGVTVASSVLQVYTTLRLIIQEVLP